MPALTTSRCAVPSLALSAQERGFFGRLRAPFSLRIRLIFAVETAVSTTSSDACATPQYFLRRYHHRRTRSVIPSSELNSLHPSPQGTTAPLTLSTTRGAFPNRASPLDATTAKIQDRRVSATRLVAIATARLRARSHSFAALLASCSVIMLASEGNTTEVAFRPAPARCRRIAYPAPIVQAPGYKSS